MAENRVFESQGVAKKRVVEIQGVANSGGVMNLCKIIKAATHQSTLMY